MARRSSNESIVDPYVGTSISRTFPLFFWRRCDKCKQEFRREWGWYFVTGPYYNGRGHGRFLCGSCAKSWDDVAAYTNWNCNYIS